MFDFKDFDDEKRCKFAILRLGKSASLWYEGLKNKRIRADKEKISSWELLKRKLRKRYVPSTHRISIYRRIADFKQGKLSVGEYIDEFENLSLMGEVEEIEEQKMSRFLRGLNYSIANSVELYPYADFDTLCGLCLKLEAQGKVKYGVSSNSDYAKNKQVERLSSLLRLMLQRVILHHLLLKCLVHQRKVICPKLDVLNVKVSGIIKMLARTNGW